MVDENGYPDQGELNTIRHWPAHDLHGMMDYVEKIWHMPWWGWKVIGDDRYEISTGGWSGNEDIIAAMRDNEVWWSTFMSVHRRGGHYVFSRPGQ